MESLDQKGKRATDPQFNGVIESNASSLRQRPLNDYITLGIGEPSDNESNAVYQNGSSSFCSSITPRIIRFSTSTNVSQSPRVSPEHFRTFYEDSSRSSFSQPEYRIMYSPSTPFSPSPLVSSAGSRAFGATNGEATPAWDEKLWTDQFADVHGLAAASFIIPPLILGFGLYNSRSLSYSEECDPGTDVTQRAILEAVGSVTCLSAAIVMSYMEKAFVRGLSAFDLARQRLRINIRFLVCFLLIMVGATLMGLSMMDFIQVRLGMWSCESASSHFWMVLLCVWVVFADLYLICGIRRIFSAP